MPVKQESAPTPPKASDLTRLAREGESITVRNTQKGLAVFTNDLGTQDQTEWQGTGDPEGRDILEIPATYLRNANFRRMLNLGVFVIEDADNPEVLRAAEAQRGAWTARNRHNEQVDSISIHQQPQSSAGRYVIDDKGKSIYTEAPTSIRTLGDKIPQGAGPGWVMTETGNFIDGKAEVIWSQPQITGR